MLTVRICDRLHRGLAVADEAGSRIVVRRARGRVAEGLTIAPGSLRWSASISLALALAGDLVDILPAMNDQDSNRSPEGNVLRFALHRQGQDSQVCTRCHGMPWRSSLLVLPNSVGLGYRPTGWNVQPSTGGRKGFLPALDDRVSDEPLTLR